MSFFDYQRLDNILNFLIEKKNAVHITELSSFCNVSDRTIRSDINTINSYIQKQGAHIILIRKKGYLLEYTDKERFDIFWSNQDTGTFLFNSSDSRLNFLIRIFLTSDEYITQEYLQSILFVSQNTLYSDFRTLREYFSPYNLKINNKSNLGYKLLGNESDIRSAIVNLIFKENLTDYLTANISVDRNICNNINYELFSQIFLKYFSEQIELDSDYFYRNIFSSILLTTSRVKSGHTLSNFDKDISLKNNATKIVNNFITNIEEQFSLTFSPLEISFIYYCIAENHPSLIEETVDQSIHKLAEQIVIAIQDNLENLTSASWTRDSILKTNLLEHIKLFLKIQTIEADRNNPLLDTIKSNFPFAFDLAISCSQCIVQDYDIHFSEDEISYLALHFANAIERNTSTLVDQFSLAIICGSGKTFSSIIETKIKRKFPDRFSNIEKFSYSTFQNRVDSLHFDLIVSTVPVKISDIPIVRINLEDLETSMNLVEDELNLLSISKEKDELLSEERFLLLEQKMDKIDVLNIISSSLLNQNLVNNNFLNEVNEREAISSTIISESIAIPHPLGNSVLKSSIFTVIAPKGINWDGKNIKFVFMFAIKNDNTEKMQNVYEKILDFISSENLQNNLLKNPNYQTLKSIFTLSVL